MGSRLGIAVGLALTALGAVAAAAEPPRRVPPVQTFQQGGVGCYWYRQRYFCSSYCYLEVDGKRYCVERERRAHSQAAELDDDDRGRVARRPYSGAK